MIVLEAMIKMNNPNYVASGWKTAVISIGFSIFQGFLNTHAFQIIPWIEVIAGILYGAEFVIFIVVLAVMGVRNPASFLVSTNYSSGWTNTFVASNVGMLTAIWCFTGRYTLHSYSFLIYISCQIPRLGLEDSGLEDRYRS